MTSYQYTNLSGSGFQAFTAPGVYNFARCAITDSGAGHPIDVTDTQRWLDIGFWAWYEDYPGEDETPDGQYLSDIHWITWLDQGWSDNYPSAAAGVDGFYYSLKPGVVATFRFYTP